MTKSPYSPPEDDDRDTDPVGKKNARSGLQLIFFGLGLGVLGIGMSMLAFPFPSTMDAVLSRVLIAVGAAVSVVGFSRMAKRN